MTLETKWTRLVRSVPALRWAFETKTGEIVVAQAPNPPILVAIALTVAGYVLPGAAGIWASRGAAAAFAVWSVLEIGWGVNPWRRALGAVVLAGLVATRL